jgi:hypothetical protein
VVNVTGLGETDDGVDKHVGLSGAGSNDGQLTVSAVHRVTGLESDNLGPAELLEVSADLSRSVAESDVVVVHEALDNLDLTTNVDITSGLVEVLDGRVLWVPTEDELGLGLLVGPVDVVDGQDDDVAVVTRVAESDAVAGLEVETLDLGLGEIEVDGHREEVAVGETVVLADAGSCQRLFLVRYSILQSDTPIVVLLVHETLERGEATVDDELEIAKLALVEDDGGELLGLGGELSVARSIAGNKILKDTTCDVVVSMIISQTGLSGSPDLPWGGLAMMYVYVYALRSKMKDV